MNECVNMLLYWKYVVRLNTPQRCAWQKNKKKKKIIHVMYMEMKNVIRNLTKANTQNNNDNVTEVAADAVQDVPTIRHPLFQNLHGPRPKLA